MVKTIKIIKHPIFKIGCFSLILGIELSSNMLYNIIEHKCSNLKNLEELKMKKSVELQEKLTKAQERVEKTKKTIERHEARAKKLLAEIESKGLTTNRYDYAGGVNHEAYWLICDYDGKLEDIKNATKKLAEAEQIAKNWQEKLDKQLALENKIAYEMPAIFTQLKEDLAKEWTEYDIEARNRMKVKRRELDYEAFRKLYTYGQEQSLSHTDEEFKKMNEREAELWIIDLFNRVKAVTGEVTDWSNIYFRGKALNGFVVGKEGKALVETILAGGYNIQRLHYRVLVKAM